VLPDILFLDIMMPEINGYDVCRTIKNDPVLKKIYVIMLTAKGQVAEQERGKAVGADEYIVKPFSPMEILTKIKNILNTGAVYFTEMAPADSFSGGHALFLEKR
jgi:DNA-binding response OmpR family regulator